MKTLLRLAVGAVPLLATGIALAQSGSMMDGGGWGMGWMGGYGGMGALLFVIVVVGVVVLVMQRKGK